MDIDGRTPTALRWPPGAVRMDETYAFNGRLYRLVADEAGWTIVTGRPGETPIRQAFAGESMARAAWVRMIAATIVNHPRRLFGAQINDTLLVLAVDGEGRAHIGELAGPRGDAAATFTEHADARNAWRDRCCELAFAAVLSDSVRNDDETEAR